MSAVSTTDMPAADTRTASLTAVAAQLELALRESVGPVDELGRALGRMSDELAHIRIAVAATAEEKLHANCREVIRELSTCMESLQFYDRMVQHLSHLRDYLAGLSANPAGQAAAGGEPADWERLREALRRRLISEAQRELLDLILPPPHAPHASRAEPRSAHALHVGEGSIELF